MNYRARSVALYTLIYNENIAWSRYSKVDLNFWEQYLHEILLDILNQALVTIIQKSSQRENHEFKIITGSF